MITEPLYKTVLSLKIDQAWLKIVEFSRDYPILKIDRSNATIVLNVGYPTKLLARSTWIEGIKITLKELNNNSTMIKIDGRVLMSPHHLFRSAILNKKKIDKDVFLHDVMNAFNKCMTVMPKYTKGNIRIKSIFWFFELSSIFIFLMLIQFVLIRYQDISPKVIICVLLFVVLQASLIIWFARECYSRIDLSYRERNQWVTFICMTGFVGCYCYYIKMGLRDR